MPGISEPIRHPYYAENPEYSSGHNARFQSFILHLIHLTDLEYTHTISIGSQTKNSPIPRGVSFNVTSPDPVSDPTTLYPP